MDVLYVVLYITNRFEDFLKSVIILFKRCKVLIYRFDKIFKPYFKFDIFVTVHRAKYLTIKPTIYANFSNLFLE